MSQSGGMAAPREQGVSLVVNSSVFGFARFGGHRLCYAFLGDALWVRALAGGCAGEGTIESVDVNLSFASLRLKGGVHGGQELRPEFMEDLIDIDVRQLPLRGLVTKSTWGGQEVARSICCLGSTWAKSALIRSSRMAFARA